MRRNRGDEAVQPRSPGGQAAVKAGQPGPAVLPATLCQLDEDQLTQMEPGDAILLDRAPGLRRHAAPGFCAVIACPACGVPGLITPQQFFGVVPVICPSDRCSCCFRIVEQSVLIYLPVS